MEKGRLGLFGFQTKIKKGAEDKKTRRRNANYALIFTLTLYKSYVTCCWVEENSISPRKVSSEELYGFLLCYKNFSLNIICIGICDFVMDKTLIFFGFILPPDLNERLR